ncbi:TPA: hypothetical protein N2N50_000142 [Kluyvera ascorbata]|uniref:hypothetical protein n=1 Tax=Kluyvera ascorbata TaxID=51288 RepID=UPI0018A48FD6|nr:hypothetical protein [Kluyvera ascorbata]BBV63709.1 hypothetical protein STW0522KLE44_00970 [Klebsiella sp. STW0522-44]MDU3911426.1 hypothetical protein [Kluyvera ascorbata]HAT7513725.1 hypothetical protein [Kluyvera ascorbata]HCL5619196.1 hypothetical protein [Kluyvera ascorbata]HDG1665597.1 hypothetical protein [Kluyvera ascorbata]
MNVYQNRGHDSGITQFETGTNSIAVYFSDDSAYLYNATAPGVQMVAEMTRLAQSGEGLNSYINRYVRANYAQKIR